MRTLLKNAWVYTPGGVLRDGFVAVDGTQITAVSTERPEGTFDREKDMSGRLLLPGLQAVFPARHPVPHAGPQCGQA